MDLAALPIARRAAASLHFLKSARGGSPATAPHVPGVGADQKETSAFVAALLQKLEEGGEAECLRVANELDGWPLDAPVLVTAADIARATASLTMQMRQDIEFQHARVYSFAKQQAVGTPNPNPNPKHQ
jgi:histidinol dehydrogenase